jgi:alcohol dehydrogenase (cytochrome c)
MKRLPRVIAACVMSVAATVLTQGAPPGQLGQPPADPPMPAVLTNYKSVTAERLRTPDDQDWLMIRRTYDGWGFSPLSDITPANVQRLKPVWVFSTA